MYLEEKNEPKALDLVPDISTPSLKGLAYLLRHRELWPKHFEWSFRSGCRCAIGLSSKFWGIPMGNEWHKTLDVTPGEFRARRTFGNGGYHDVGLYDNDVQPEHVADRIEQFYLK
jgi:hypothetical protein